MVNFPNKREALYQTIHAAMPGYRNNNQGVKKLKDWIFFLGKPPKSILEVGCGNGMLCEVLAAMGGDVTGLDITPGPYDHEHKAYHFIQHDIQLGCLPFEDNTFDYCLCFDVIEHLHPKWSRQVIWDMMRVARKGVGSTIACFGKERLHLTIKTPKEWKEIIEYILPDTKFKVYKEPKGKTLLFMSTKENKGT